MEKINQTLHTSHHKDTLLPLCLADSNASSSSKAIHLSKSLCDLSHQCIFSYFFYHFVLQSSIFEEPIAEYGNERINHISGLYPFHANKTAFVFGAIGIYSTMELSK
jgi:hypothetical protein